MEKKTIRLATVAATAVIGVITGAGMASAAASPTTVSVDLAEVNANDGSVLAQAISRATSEAGAAGPLTTFSSVAPRL
ncbi:hypothetical protein [Streptosporangium sp. KLBMP 9127]|nr:hypothetical protein [Streptosporangium sp. KLBMP 9127]